MQNGFLISLLAVVVISSAYPQSTPQSPQKKATSKKPVHSASKGTARSTSARPSKSSRRPGRVSDIARVSRQLTPTPERYRDIQQALVEKGYLKSEPTGVWDAQSSDALRQFQTDQKLSPTGKISSATLIGLGLGPKASTESSAPEPKPEPGTPRSERNASSQTDN